MRFSRQVPFFLEFRCSLKVTIGRHQGRPKALCPANFVSLRNCLNIIGCRRLNKKLIIIQILRSLDPTQNML
jgi:hypothetical protein